MIPASGDLEIGGLSQGPNLFNGLIDEFSVTIGPLPADVIARIYANAGQGTDLGGSGTQDTTVAGNFIGTDPAGTTAIANGGDGVEINGAFNNTIGGGGRRRQRHLGQHEQRRRDHGGSSTIIQGNTVGSSPGLGNHIGLYDPATPITLGGTDPGQSNFYGYNNGPGVLLGPAAAVGSSALGERFAGDSDVGILIGTLTTPTSAPAPFTPSSPLFSPVITESSIQSGLLEISGYALPGSIIGFYASASTDVHGNGEGVEFLGSYVEGSTDDTNSTVGTGTMAGANQFNFTFVVPSSITPGMSVTAISGGTAGAPGGFPVRRRFADHRRVGRAHDQQRRQRHRSRRPDLLVPGLFRRQRQHDALGNGQLRRRDGQPGSLDPGHRPSRPPVTTNTRRWRRARTISRTSSPCRARMTSRFRSSTATATRPRLK